VEQRTQATRGGIAKRRKTKRGEKVRRESERLMVPKKPGNQARGNPVEGLARRVAEALGGNMAGAQEPGCVSTKHQQLAVLALLMGACDSGWIRGSRFGGYHACSETVT